MALVAEKGVFVSPGGTGNQTTNLGSAFNGVLPKVLFLWMTFETADGAGVNGDIIFTRGIGTYDGGSAQMINNHYYEDDATAAQQCVEATGASHILRGVTADGTTGDYAATLVSLNSGTPSTFVLNWSDLPGTGSIRIHYLALGGSDISAARCGQFDMTVTVATQDVTINAGFGQPDILLFQGSGYVATAGFSQRDGRTFFSAAKSSTERRTSHFGGEDGSAAMACSSWQVSRALAIQTATPGNIEAEVDLSTVGSWPTDGFELNYINDAGAALAIGYLAIKGTLTCTIGSNTCPTAGSPPVAQNLTLASGTPKAAIFWGNSIATNAGIDQTHADLGAHFVGSTDGTNEGVCGLAQDDAALTSLCGRFFTTTKAIQHYKANSGGAAPDLQSECDSSFSGSDVVLSWNDIDSVAREYNYVIFGEPAGAAATSLLWQPAPSTIYQI